MELARIAGGDRVSVGVAGHSVRGEPVWTLSIEPPQPPRATVFIISGIHAMEHVGVATAVAVLARAASSATPWREHRIVAIPIANPDGFLAVERALAAGRRGFIRKNARGVDLNRNFAASWDDRYYLHRLARGVFSPGEAPLSEPETQAIDRAVAECRPTYALSLHAFGEWIFLPYAGRREPPPRFDRMRELARAMTEAQPHRPYKVMQLAMRSRLFRACGAEIDHFTERYGALSFLIEIGAGPRLSEPTTWLDPYRWFNPPASLLERDVANVIPAIERLASEVE